MSAFKVGQRVRIISHADSRYFEIIGAEGVIVRASDNFPSRWIVDVSEFPRHNPHSPLAPTEYSLRPECLTPLTDPSADAWAANAVKRVTKLLPDIVKERHEA